MGDGFRVGIVAAWMAAVGMACGGDDDVGPGPGDGGTMDATGGDGGGGDSGPRDDSGGVDGGGVDGGGVDGGGSDGGAGDAAADGGPVSMPCTPTGDCDPFDPSACPDGQSCRPSTVSGTSCQAIIASPVSEGETCATAQDCAPGLLCLNFGDGFTCERLCPDGSIGFCSDGQACTGTIGDACVQVCRPTPTPCDIYAQDCADPDDTCSFVRHPETTTPYTGCRPAGTQGHGDPCGGMDGTCGHSLVCVREGDVVSCHYVCDPDGGDPTCTEAGEACTGFARTWMVGYCQ